MLQQHLPFTVLKPRRCSTYRRSSINVATALTVYGIETIQINPLLFRSIQ